MLSREDFVFTIGYDGPAAVVDGQARRRYGSLSTAELAERGLFRAAWSSAVYSKDPGEKALVLEKYNQAAGTLFSGDSPPSAKREGSPPDPDRLFGVFPADVKRVMVL